MKVIKPLVRIADSELSRNKISKIADSARKCYLSDCGASDNTVFIRKLINSGHESPIEHEKVTVTFVVDRGISNEIVRHRIASFSQESTRYCNYSKSKFNSEITVIEPFFFDELEYQVWLKSCKHCEESYLKLTRTAPAEQARAVLPNSLKTELVTTFNFREWRHFFIVRCSKGAHIQMRQVAIPLLLLFKSKLTPLFEDIPFDTDFPSEHYAYIDVYRDASLNK